MAHSERRQDLLGVLGAAAFGVVAFFVWSGWKFLDPQNIAWLRTGDRAMHTTGWFFYRVTPWGLPPGINPRNGLEVPSSVALSDSLPLFAAPFKLLSPLLPTVFQYWGIWFLTCMVLQGVFGYLIGRELKLDRWVSLLLAACLVMTPVFLWRMPVHMALAGHWVLLWALWLYVKEKAPPVYAWPLMLAVTSSVHAYLLAIALAIWGASLVQRLWLGRLRWGGLALELVLGLAASLAVLWAAGFFLTSSLAAEGFGFYRMNLDTFLDPNRWSFILPDLPSTPGDYEGQMFPGLGVLLLFILALVVAGPRLRSALSPRWLPLLLVIIGLAIFAMSDKPVFGRIEFGTIPLPPAILSFASMFRASGRMIWPAAYCVVLLAFVLLATRFRPHTLVAIASVALVVQIVDTSPGWTQFRTTQPPSASTWPTLIKSPFWEFAARHYDKVRALPVTGMNKHWAELSYYAAFHGMASDAAYLGRRDEKGLVRLEQLADAALEDGDFEPDALYVLNVDAALRTRPFVAPDDLFVEVDGLIVFARHGAAYARADNFKLPPSFSFAPAPHTTNASLGLTAG